MNIREQLLFEHSKANAQIIANYIGTNTDRVAVLISCFLSKEYRVSQRSSMVLSIIGDKNPELLTVHIGELISALTDKSEKVAVVRCIVRFFQFYDLPESYQGVVLEHCYFLLKNNEEPVAIRAFSIGVIYRISKEYEELKNELKLVLQDLYTGDSTGLENRKNNILKLL